MRKFHENLPQPRLSVALAIAKHHAGSCVNTVEAIAWTVS